MKSKSVLFALITSVILLIISIAVLFCIPSVLHWYFGFRRFSHRPFVQMTVICYICDIVAAITLAFLIRLLTRIRAGHLFDTVNCNILHIFSICVLIVCIVAAYGCYYYFPFAILSAAAFFLFLILRVLKTVYTSAVEIKDENDMTI